MEATSIPDPCLTLEEAEALQVIHPSRAVRQLQNSARAKLRAARFQPPPDPTREDRLDSALTTIADPGEREKRNGVEFSDWAQSTARTAMKEQA